MFSFFIDEEIGKLEYILDIDNELAHLFFKQNVIKNMADKRNSSRCRVADGDAYWCANRIKTESKTILPSPTIS